MTLFAGKRPARVGVHNGALPPPPSTPNAVSSDARTPIHFIDPLCFKGSPAVAMSALERIVASLPRTRIVSSENGYLRAEAASAVFGFVDDLEFLVDEGRSIIHVRSAARIGYSDFGVNRQRIELIRRRFRELQG